MKPFRPPLNLYLQNYKNDDIKENNMRKVFALSLVSFIFTLLLTLTPYENVQEIIINDTTAPPQPVEIPAVMVPSEAKPTENEAVMPEILLSADEAAICEIENIQFEVAEDKPFSMVGSLFIGDSRTTGLADFSKLDGVDYFADVGMNVYTVGKRTLTVDGFGETTLTSLLEAKNYNKIYIMLGINEVGYAFEKTAKAYGNLIDMVRAHQPDVEIIVQANLHVTHAHSERAKYVKNEAIYALNDVLHQLADEKGCHFIDANEIFDDENGALKKELSGDGVHLRAQYYIEWGEWIEAKSKEIPG